MSCAASPYRRNRGTADVLRYQFKNKQLATIHVAASWA
jgi:hypothetical protein